VDLGDERINVNKEDLYTLHSPININGYWTDKIQEIYNGVYMGEGPCNK
jgi:hypothetical protein